MDQCRMLFLKSVTSPCPPISTVVLSSHREPLLVLPSASSPCHSWLDQESSVGKDFLDSGSAPGMTHSWIPDCRGQDIFVPLDSGSGPGMTHS